MQLRRLEHDNDRGDPLRGDEFREEDFPGAEKGNAGWIGGELKHE